MEFLLILLVFLAVVAIVAAPLRAGRTEAVERRESAELADLEAAKEAKYREIRDAEMDFRTGKLSEADHKALDRQLRAEAIQLLRRIDAVRGQARSPQAAEEPAEAPARDDAPVG
jgi:flagellar biosynthesis/type III secretory pathway M-ring protein FliF/YscJ